MSKLKHSASERNKKWYGSKWITPERRAKIYARDNWRCVYCRRDLRDAPSRQRTLDHIEPVSIGHIDNSSTNLVTCCRRCNESKQGRSVYEYLNGDLAAVLLVYIQAALAIDARTLRQK